MMDNREVQFWLKCCYPTTIIKDRYQGTYSDGKWLAFPIDYHQVPKDIDSGDIECMMFWDSYTGCVGKGNTVEEAFSDLVVKMKRL
jgi:predicted Abi (CAAX) family protease